MFGNNLMNGFYFGACSVNNDMAMANIFTLRIGRYTMSTNKNSVVICRRMVLIYRFDTPVFRICDDPEIDIFG